MVTKPSFLHVLHAYQAIDKTFLTNFFLIIGDTVTKSLDREDLMLFDIFGFKGLFYISATLKAVMKVNYRVIIMFEN